MATYQTPNLDLTYGDQGETDWHVWMNSNIQKLDFDFQTPIAHDTSTMAVTVAVGTIWVGNSGTATLHTTNTEYLTVSGTSTPSTTEANHYIVLPKAGRIKNFRVYLSAAPGSSKSRTFTVRVNGVDSDVTCTVSNTAIEAQDVTNIIELGAGALISIESVPTSTPAAAQIYFGLEFEQYGVDTGS